MRDADFEKAVWAIPCVETAWIPAFGENDTRVCVLPSLSCVARVFLSPSFSRVFLLPSLSCVVRLFLLLSFSSLARESRSSVETTGLDSRLLARMTAGEGEGHSHRHMDSRLLARMTHTRVCCRHCHCRVSFFCRHSRVCLSFAVIVVCRASLSFAVILEPCSGIQVFSGKQRGGWKTGDEKACQTTVVWAGAPGGSRTPNPQIRSLMLYPLSYGRTPRSSSPIWAALSTGAGRAGSHHTITPNGAASCGARPCPASRGLIRLRCGKIHF